MQLWSIRHVLSGTMIRANTQWKWRQIRFLDLWAELPSGSLNIKPTMLRPQIYSIIMNGIHKPVLFLYVLPLQHNTSSKIHWDKLDKEIFFFLVTVPHYPFSKSNIDTSLWIHLHIESLWYEQKVLISMCILTHTIF